MKHSEKVAKLNAHLTPEQIRANKCARSKQRNATRRAERREEAEARGIGTPRPWTLVNERFVSYHKAKSFALAPNLEKRVIYRPGGYYQVKYR